MELTPKLLQDVEFRQEWRGYNRAEVDDFLDRVAVSVELLLDRLRQAGGREESSGADERVDEDAISRALVLAQRTADAAIDDARKEAARIVDDAAARAAAMMADAEEALDIGRLEARRDALVADVAALEQYLEQQRTALGDALDGVRQMLADDVRLAPGPELGSGNGSRNAEPNDADPPVEIDLRYESLMGSGGTPATGGEWPDPDFTMAEDTGPPTGEVDLTTLEADDEPLFPMTDDWGPPAQPLVALGEEDDPFLAELRKAVTDDEPLGPRDDLPEHRVPLFDQDSASEYRG